MNHIPYVVESGENGETRHDLYSRLLKDRIIFLGGAIDAPVANIIVAQLLFLASQDPSTPIKLYINSPGGSVISGLSIIDTMDLIPNDIETIAVGMAASMGSLILSNGTKGKRKALPNSTVMIHQVSSTGYGGQASDIVISANRIVKLKNILNRILSDNCGQDISKVERDCDRDYYMDASEALAYGIIDEIVGKKNVGKVNYAGTIDEPGVLGKTGCGNC